MHSILVRVNGLNIKNPAPINAKVNFYVCLHVKCKAKEVLSVLGAYKLNHQPSAVLHHLTTAACKLLSFYVFSRMVVELHRKVSSLIEYLKQKWTYHDQRIVSFKTSYA